MSENIGLDCCLPLCFTHSEFPCFSYQSVSYLWDRGKGVHQALLIRIRSYSSTFPFRETILCRKGTGKGIPNAPLTLVAYIHLTAFSCLNMTIRS